MALVFLKKAQDFLPEEKAFLQSQIREGEFHWRQSTRLGQHFAFFLTGEKEPLPTPALLRLRSAAAPKSIDVISLSESFFAHPPPVVFFDMDSTVIREEVIDELAREHGVYEEVARMTRAAMEGGWDFDTALTKRVALLRGLSRSSFQKVHARLRLNPGMDELFAKLPRFGTKIIILSGGFQPILEMFSQNYPVHAFWANVLEEEGGLFTGRILGEIVNAQRKKEKLIAYCQSLGVAPESCVAVGDGANDALMLQASGLGIGYHAKQGLKDQITNWVDHCDLDALLFLFHDNP